MVLYHQDTTKCPVGTELNFPYYNTGQGLLNDTKMPWMLNVECLIWNENNEARHGARGSSHGKVWKLGDETSEGSGTCDSFQSCRITSESG